MNTINVEENDVNETGTTSESFSSGRCLVKQQRRPGRYVTAEAARNGRYTTTRKGGDNHWQNEKDLKQDAQLEGPRSRWSARILAKKFQKHT